MFTADATPQSKEEIDTTSMKRSLLSRDFFRTL
jgi:hypothetical protein